MGLEQIEDIYERLLQTDNLGAKNEKKISKIIKLLEEIIDNLEENI